MIEKEDQTIEDSRDLFEVRKKFKWDPSIEETSQEEEVEEEVLGTAEMLCSLKEGERGRRKEEMTDGLAHTYDLVYDLTPDLGSDAYYHGPHPEPPARVVRTILKATKQKPFIDPDELSTVQLEALTRKVWEQEGMAISVGFGTGKEDGEGNLTREEMRVQKEMNLDEYGDWEERVVAGFSSTCHERIGRGSVGRPLGGKGIREMANHLQQSQTQPTTTSSAPPTSAGVSQMASQLTTQGYSLGQVQGQAQLAANVGYGGEREREREYHQQQKCDECRWSLEIVLIVSLSTST